MIYQIYYLPIQYWLLAECFAHVAKNNSDIFISYGHSDIERPFQVPLSKPGQETVTGTDKISVTKSDMDRKETVKERVDKAETEGVLFIPNDKPVFRNEDIYNDEIKIHDVVETRRIGGLVGDDKIRITETESPKTDVLFVSGKNNENLEKPAKYDQKQDRQDSTVIKQERKARTNKNKLNCTHIECNNTLNSVCGAKEENKQIKYRLFLNECFFRKVNCGFQHAINRYIMVSMENCKNIGAHYQTRPYVFKPIPVPPQKEVVKSDDTRRSFSSRRSLSMGVDGAFCGHACPASCTEEYAPQCAVSGGGRRRVFLNHCRLDRDSCLYRVVWHRRPLSECVGGKKADVAQNSGFIGWMQRVGIVDRKGRLVLT